MKVECYMDASWGFTRRVSNAFLVYENGKCVHQWNKTKWKEDGVTEEQMTVLPLLSYLSIKYKNTKCEIHIYTDNSSVLLLMDCLKKNERNKKIDKTYFNKCLMFFRNIQYHMMYEQVPRDNVECANTLAKNGLNEYHVKYYPNGIVQYAIDDLSYTKNKWETMFKNSEYGEVKCMATVIKNAIDMLELLNMNLKSNK